MCMSGDGGGRGKNIVFQREKEGCVYSGEYHINLKELDAFFELDFLLWEGLGGRSMCVLGGKVVNIPGGD